MKTRNLTSMMNKKYFNANRFFRQSGEYASKDLCLINMNKLFTKKRFIILIASKVRNLNNNYCKLFPNIK